jgi:MGT family glycosyltransferase
MVPPALDDPAAPPAPPPLRFRAPRAHAAPAEARPGADGPLVYMTFGSVAASLGFHPDLYRRALAALADLPARVLVTTGADADPAELGPLPANARAERWVPQDQVVAQAAAVVCHGGHGSVLGALARGVPLALMPLFGDDQWRNARRVARAGAGVLVGGGDDAGRAFLAHPGDRTLASLHDAVARLLADDGHRDRARAIARDMARLPRVADAAARLTTSDHDDGRGLT